MQQHKIVARVHHSLLAVYERHLLVWLAAQLPRIVTPTRLTLLGFAGALLSGLAYAATLFSTGFLWLATAGLIINWFGDSLDGTLARYRQMERPQYGFFIDHTTDVASQVVIFLGLGISPYMHLETACLALMSYWMAALYTFIRAIATNIFQISYYGIGPTEIRLALISYNAALLFVGPIVLRTRLGAFSPIDIFCGILFIIVFLAFLTLIVSEGHRLAVLETSPTMRPARQRSPFRRFLVLIQTIR
jgi:archaetidylinositol phosphate synthase